MTEPTDAELDELRQANGGKLNFVTFSEFRTIARAALAKWGAQPAVAGEQVDRADAVNLARNTLTQHDRAITKKGARVLAEAVLSMDAALTTPQPTQAQAGACEWKHDDDDGFWESACGEAWQFNDGGPADNNVRFCQGCGKPVLITPKEGGQHVGKVD